MEVPVRFEKWQALGNDYLILERKALPFELTPERVRRLCAGHLGVFADGVLELAPSSDPDYVADLRIYNPDGSRAELSGNGAREAILYLRHRGWTELDTFAILTDAGPIRPQITGPRTCRVDMGTASLQSENYPTGAPDGRGEVQAAGRTWSFQHVWIGNPQCAIQLSDLRELESLELGAIGPDIESSQLFPNRTNVSWFAELGEGRIRARIFERGVGETLSSGTGATGAAVAYLQQNDRRSGAVTVELDGGELEVEVGENLDVALSGWAVPVFAGELSEDFEKELYETE
jgi:diaminopimelate epimerase